MGYLGARILMHHNFDVNNLAGAYLIYQSVIHK